MKSFSKHCCISVAGFCYSLDSARGDARFFLPECYDKFDVSSQNSEWQKILNITIQSSPKTIDLSPYPLTCLTDIWELRRTDQGGLVFSTKRNNFPKTLIIENNYTKADLFGNFKTTDGLLTYPLENLDMLIAVNWLAEQGDLVLHASGVIVDGEGYAFLGKSGAGKSTLAAALAKDHHAQVLGEDQIILRHMENKFWIFGTPWHENPAMCSPEGIPLAALFFLDRETDYGIQSISAPEGLSRIMQTAFVPYYRPELIPSIIDNLVKLAVEIPFYQLSYRLGEDVYSTYLQDL